MKLHFLDVNEDLGAVLDELIDVNAEWENLGLVLKLTPGKLKTIRNQRPDDDKRMWNVIEVWMKRGEATWRGLITALEDKKVDEGSLAKTIRKKVAAKACAEI